jgi:outer membrane biosynthesis protein TonB
MLRQAGATLLFDPDHSPIVGTQALIDHKTVALGAIRSGAPGEPDGLDNLTVLKGQPEEVNQFRDFFTTHKGHAQNLFAPAAQQTPAAPKPTAPVVQPQAPAQTQPQIIQQPISQPQAPPAQQATINPNDPASLLQAAREAAARGDQNRAAAYLEAAKNADRRMQEAAAAASGVRMPA